jgi:diadenosine tetraphosphate (Ap4A) HIT family hydrolase
LAESELVYAMADKFPVSPGHTLIIPRRHCADYFLLLPDELSACWALVNKMKLLLDNQYHPDGYNIGINNLEAAGQTVPHVHIHLIPRYHGDVARPQGGVRGVILARKEY